MSSYALLTALSGFSCSAAEARVGFAPRIREDSFRCFFCLECGWGLYGQKKSRGWEITLEVRYGELRIRQLELAVPARRLLGAAIEGRTVQASWADGRVTFDPGVSIHRGERLTVHLE